MNCACTPRHREKRSGGVVLRAAVMAALLPLGLLNTQQPRGAEASIFHPAGCWQAAFHIPSAVRGAVLLGEMTVLPVGDPGVAVRVVSSSLSVGLHRLTPSPALGTCMSLRAACRSVT